jgi:leader peptidase (prepilin peptidase)/N-methyltransferase
LIPLDSTPLSFPSPIPEIVQAFAFMIGAAVGSFLNVCIYRIPIEGLSVNSPRGSFCPGCKTALRWFENLPILGWLWLRGKCRTCSIPISFRYPFVELLTGILFLVALRLFALESILENPIGPAAIGLLTLWVWLSCVVVVSGIDLDHRIIPDRFSIPMTCGVLLLSSFNPFLPGVTLPSAESPVLPWLLAVGVGVALGSAFQRWVPNWSGNRRTCSESVLAYVAGFQLGHLLGSLGIVGESLPTLLVSREGQALLGAMVGAGMIWGIGLIGQWIFRKPAMGFGDVKWMGMLGATIGPIPVVISFFIACLLGSVIGLYLRIRRGQQYIPFGPFLSAGAVLWILARPQLEAVWNAYLGLFQN